MTADVGLNGGSTLSAADPIFPGQIELSLLAGFVDPIREPRHGVRKQAASVLRARIAAVDLALIESHPVGIKRVAERCGATERTIHRHFPTREALFAFPPPEMASALVASCFAAESWDDAVRLVRTVFVALDANRSGRELMAGLVNVHQLNPGLSSTDGYFLAELRALIESRTGGYSRSFLPLLGLFTEALREGFRLWAVDPTKSTTGVIDGAIATVQGLTAHDFVLTFFSETSR